MYCTIEEARAAGATGDDAAVLAAIAAARRAIDRYTGDVFAPTTLTVIAYPAADGSALLPFMVRSVSAVRAVGAATDLPTGSYRVLSSSTFGQYDAVVLGGGELYNVLVLGAEPWNGGYRGLTAHTQQLSVTGEFGPDETPAEVRECAALYAAHLTTLSQPQPGMPGALPDVDDEGNVVVITVDANVRRAPTTGHELVDALLSGYVKQRLDIS